MFHNEPGWIGAFTRSEVLGAYRNGSRVVKVKAESGDAHPVGTMATVLGSVMHPSAGLAYFVEWDDTPRVATAVVSFKIKLVEPRRALGS